MDCSGFRWKVSFLGCRPLSCVCYGSATVVLPGASPSFQCPLSFPLYSPSSVWGLALGALLVALRTYGDLAAAPLFSSCCLLLVLVLVAVSSCPLLYSSALLFRFAFLVRIPPSRGFSALVFGRSLGSSVTVRCFVLFSIVWDHRLCFPFFLSVSGCSSASVDSLVPLRWGPAVWAESVAFAFSALLLVPCPAHAFWCLGVGHHLLLSSS